MWQRRCCKDAPVNNLMVRSQSACSFQGPGTSGSRPGPMGWLRFHGFSMIAKDLIPEVGTNSFAIMKCLLKSRVRRSHLPPRAHFPRVPGAFIADLIIAGRYPRYVSVPE
jgi:hypothetical protein